MSRRKKIVLLGATGSIGGNALRVIERHADKLELVGIVARRRLDALAEIALAHSVNHVGVFESPTVGSRESLPDRSKFYSGIEGICDLIRAADPDLVLVATTGTAALKPTLAAIEAGKNIALATKEILVLAGRFIAEAARRKGVRVIPIDSEHNAIFQCLEGSKNNHMRRLVLTASGGAFRDAPLESLAAVTPKEALAHPNWSMGDKVTIDSATMANKGLEIIEAHWLFDARPDQIDVVIHPQSIVHSMVEFVDGSFLAQLSPPSMTFAIQHALLYPDRAPGVDASLDLTQAFQLDR
jgi:1-deoxy-D-xylulose-5-phosphate reductoisomerase